MAGRGVEFHHNALAVASSIELHGTKVGAKAQRVVAHHGLLLQAAVKRHASKPRTGPPGPRLQTGDYVRSIALAVGLLQAEVGTSKPQGRRLEYGFSGTDALGRVYDQPPYPHFQPAADEVEPLFTAALLATMVEDW